MAKIDTLFLTKQDKKTYLSGRTYLTVYSLLPDFNP